MLVLTRKLGEKIMIGTGAEQITVMVVQIKPGQVRLGIKAPEDALILREEIVKEIMEEEN